LGEKSLEEKPKKKRGVVSLIRLSGVSIEEKKLTCQNK